MVSIRLIFDEPAWPDLAERDDVIHGNRGDELEIAVLDGGMSSGRPSIAIRLNLADGRVAIIESSALAFCSAARAIKSRYPTLED